MAVCLVALTFLPAPGLIWGGYDYGQYYVSWKLVLSGKNPYDYAASSRLQRELGFKEPVVIYAPPWSLLPSLPFAGLGFKQSIKAFIILNSILLVSCAICWARILYPGRRLPILIALCAVFIWMPAWHVIEPGQLSAWPFVGLTGWLYFHTRRFPWISGCFLALTIIKPHLGLIPGVFVGFYLLRHQQWRSIVAFVLSVLICTGLTLILRPTIWSDYISAIQLGPKPTELSTGTLDGWLRYYFQVNIRWLIWLLFASAIILSGFIGWRLKFFPKPGDKPSLDNNAYVQLVSSTLLVCVATSACLPYVFSFDFVLTLPGLIFAMVAWLQRVNTRQSSLSCWLIIGCWMALDYWLMVANQIKTSYHFELWFVPWFAFAFTCITLSYQSIAPPSTSPSPVA